MTFTKKELKVFLTVFAISSIFIHWVDWNSTSRLDLTRAVLEEGRFEIDSYANNTGDRSYINGHYYIEKSPSTSFLTIPVYGSWKLIHNCFIDNIIKNDIQQEYSIIEWANTKIIDPINPGSLISISYSLIIISTSVLFTALTTILIYKISTHFLEKDWQRIFVSFAYWLATLAFYYSMIFYNHPFPTFLVFLSFYILFMMKKSGAKNKLLFISGLLFGLSVFSEYPAVLFLIPFLLYVAYSTNKSKVFLFLIAAFIGVLPLLIYNYAILGNPLMITFQYIDQAVWEGSGLGNGSFGLNSTPNLYVALRLLMYPERGLFFYFPFLILSAFGFYFMMKKYRVEGLLILSMLVLILLFFSAYKSWWEYSSFGPRRIFLIAPFLMLPIIFSLKKIRFCLILILFLVSTFINIIGLNQDLSTFVDVFIIFNSQRANSEITKKVNSLEIVDYPLFNHHFPYFLDIGPRSRFIESFLLKDGFLDIRNILPYLKLTEEPRVFSFRLFTSPLGFVSMKLSFITTVFVLIIIFLIWKNDTVKLVMNHKLLFAILIVISILFFFSINDVGYEKNWFKHEIFNGTVYHWMSDDAVLKIYSSKGENVKFNFETITFYSNRTMELYLNENLIESFVIRPGFVKNYTTSLIKLDVGENTLRIHSIEGCDVPRDVDAWGNDYRCLSFSFSRIDKLTEEDLIKAGVFYENNWYTEEKDEFSKFKWVPEDATVSIYSDTDKTVNLELEVQSYYKNRTMEVYMNDELTSIFNANTDWNNTVVQIGLNKGDNIIRFHSIEGCDVPREVENGSDSRCLSFAFRDITIKK